MKKVVIGVVIAAVLGTGAYFGKDFIGNAAGDVVGNVVGDAAETQVTDFINKNLNKPIIIKQLQSHPLIKTATITITNKTENKISSELNLVAEGKEFTLPLNSEIIRGKVDYNGKSFGFGKIITKPDLSKFEELPKFVNNDTFSLVQYIDLTGNVSEVYSAKEISAEENGGKINFKGAEIVVDTQLIDRSAFDGRVVFNGLEASGSDNETESLTITKFNYDIKLNKSGEYTGSSSPFDILFNDHNDSFVFGMSKGTYTGIYKLVDGISMPISNIDSSFDSMTIGTKETKVTINDLKIAAGLYENDSDIVDLKLASSGNFNAASLPATLPNGKPVPVTLKSFTFSYGFNKLSKDTVNHYFEVANSFQADGGLSDEKSQVLVASLQKSDANFNLDINITAEEGATDAKVSFAMNESGKAASAEEFMSSISRGDNSFVKLVNGDVLVTMDKDFADATQLSMAAKMFLGISAENEKLTLEAELKDGTATMNGNPVPLP